MANTSSTRPALYLDLDDEITAVIDRLSSIEGDEVTLVVPKGAVVLQSAVNLKLLKKAAARYQKRLVIVTRDETGLSLASRAGIPTKASVGGKIIEANQAIQKAPEIPTIHEYGEVKETFGEPVIREGEPVEQEANQVASQEPNADVRPSLRAVVEAERIQQQLDREATQRAKVADAVAATDTSLVTQVRPSKKIRESVRPSRTIPPEDSSVSRTSQTPGDTTSRDDAAKSKKESARKFSLASVLQFARKPKERKLRTEEAIPGHGNGRGPSNSHSKDKRIRLLPKWPWKWIGVGVGSAAVIIFLVMTFGFAKASVEITPKTEKTVLDSELVGKNEVDPERKEVHGTIAALNKEGKKSVPPTGEKETGAKASGSVTINNVFSDKPQTLAAGSKIKSGGGQTFLLSASVTVPGATVASGKAVPGTATASVTAEAVGDQYNVGPGSFIFPDLTAEQQKGITASSSAAMAGGNKKKVRTLTASDVDEAKKAIQAELAPTLLTDLRAKLADGEEILEGATQDALTKVSSAVPVGGEVPEGTEQVEVKATVEVKAMVIKPEEVRAVARSELQKTVPTNQELVEQEPTITYSLKSVDFKQEKIILTVHAEQESVFRIDAGALLGELSGKTETEARELLKNKQEVEKADVKLIPVWRRHIPRGSRIYIDVR